MSQKTLLLFSEREDDQQFSTAVAQMAELNLEIRTKLDDVLDFIEKEEPAVLFYDAKSESEYLAFEAAIQERIGIYSDKIRSNAIHFLSSEPLENVQYLIHSPLFGHFVYRNYKDRSRAGKHYGKLVNATLSERAFGLQRILLPGAKIQNVQLARSDQKQEAVEAVRSYARMAKFQARMASIIGNAVDEILMNAIFDAPVDSLGRPTMLSTPRHVVVDLAGKSAVEMSVGYDGEHIAIQAIDLYGSLDKHKLLTHISKIYTTEEYRIKTSIAGAGIGLATVFRSGGSFFFSAEQGVRTEVTVLFEPCETFVEFREQFRFISTQFYF